MGIIGLKFRLFDMSLLALFNQKGRSLFSKRIVFVISFVGILGIIFLGNRESIFTVRGQTEVFNVQLTGKTINNWNISGATLIPDVLFPSEEIQLGDDSFLNALSNTEVSISSVSTGNTESLFMTLENTDSVGSIVSTGNIIQLSNLVEILIPISSSKIIPIEGFIRVGEDVGDGVDKILLSSNVRIIEKQFIQDDRYTAGNFELDSGDRITLFEDFGENKLAVSKGFLRIKPGENMEFTFHGEANSLRVERLGSHGYTIEPSIWPRLVNDPFVAGLTTIFATLFLLMEFAELFARFISGKKED